MVTEDISLAVRATLSAPERSPDFPQQVMGRKDGNHHFLIAFNVLGTELGLTLRGDKVDVEGERVAQTPGTRLSAQQQLIKKTRIFRAYIYIYIIVRAVGIIQPILQMWK